MIRSLALLPLTFGLAVLLTGIFRRYALARELLDIPNARSSHQIATPRGGGVAIILATLIAFTIAAMLGDFSWRFAIAAVGGGTLVAVIGFRDDLAHIAPRWRLAGHFLAAAWLLWWIPSLPALPLLDGEIALGPIGYLIAALYTVWLINLTNFMDGIDGIASVEVITVTIGGVMLQMVGGPDDSRWVAPLILGAATLGFLVWNWPPARIFMGDAGSGFLGFMLALLSLDVSTQTPELYWAWVILLGVFIVDATTTLTRRLRRRQSPAEAHRSHAYQHAAIRYRSHRAVVLTVAALNLLFLLPVALLVATGRLAGPIGVLVAYAPLTALALRLGAGGDQPPARRSPQGG
ncbi:MAG: glycosyltransferase family 4 protein [Gemmatimonadales bacterium]|nr:glycosyltransferase family 4 protein [Gemmatimonadales bacterium]